MNNKNRINIILISLFSIVLYANPSLSTPVDKPRLLNKKEAEVFFEKLGNKYPNEKRKIINFTKEGFINTTYTSYHSPTINSVWIADINNDKKSEYTLITYSEGSGHYDDIVFYSINQQQEPIKIEVLLQPKGYPSNVFDPPIVVENGKTYILLENISSQNKNGEPVYAGANSNAAKNAYYLVREKHKILITGTTIQLISKEITKNVLKNE